MCGRGRRARRCAGVSAQRSPGSRLFSLARAVELDALLVTDTRYQAEDWMAATCQRGTRAEVYQKPAYLPRFRDGVDGTFDPVA